MNMIKCIGDQTFFSRTAGKIYRDIARKNLCESTKLAAEKRALAWKSGARLL